MSADDQRLPPPYDDSGTGAQDEATGRDDSWEPRNGQEMAGGADEPEAPPAEMTLTEHLQELRRCLTNAFIALAVGCAGCSYFAQDLFKLLMEPMRKAMGGGNFVYTSAPEAFMTYLWVSLVAGFFATSPYIFYQLWRFIAPGLYEHERKWLAPIAFFSALCFCAGSAFGYVVVFPYAFTFFASFQGDGIVFLPKLDEYLSFSLRLLFAFGFIFELPIFIFFLSNLGVVTPQWLAKQRKYAVLVNFIVAAVLTPTPDAMTQFLMAGPLILLYEVGILVARIFGRRRPEPTDAADAADAEDAEDDAA